MKKLMFAIQRETGIQIYTDAARPSALFDETLRPAR